MPAVVRVKRRIDEEPLGAFVLNGKKRRIDENSTINSKESDDNLYETKDEISTILKFAGTVKSQDEKATKQFARLTKDEAKELAKKHRQPAVNATERARQEMRTHGHESRFKVVNCFRTIDTDTEDDTTPKEITIVDIEKQQTPTKMDTSSTEAEETPSTSTSSLSHCQNDTQTLNYTPTDSDGYVYDLYLPENDQQTDMVDYTELYLRISAFDDLVYEDRYNNESDAEASEDSNDENNFRNDYPDADDDDESIGEFDMRRAVNGLNLGSDDDDEDLSSEYNCEPYNNDFVFSLDAEDDSFEGDIDYRDVNRYGTAYARYKAKILKSMQEDDDGNYHSDSEEHSDSD